MELGPIFRALVHNRARFLLITVEVALTLAIVVNCVNMVLDLSHDVNRPTGMDEENILVATLQPFSEAYRDPAYVKAARERDLEHVRALPGVRAATGISAIPLSGGGSSTGRKAEGAKGDSTGTPYFTVSDGALEALGVELIAGRGFEPGEYRDYIDAEGNEWDQPAIVTQKLADVFYPDGNALGKRITSGGDAKSSNIIVGIIAAMHNSWPQSTRLEGRAMLVPGLPENERQIRYIVRADPGARAAVAAAIDEALIKIDDGRIVEHETLAEIKQTNYGSEIGLIKILGAVVVLLVLVTAFGIVGLTSFTVAQRRRQIGTRRALGATRPDILRYFLLENWLVTGSGIVLGLALAWGLNYALSVLAQVPGAPKVDTPKLDWLLLAGGMVLLWLSGLLAALVPALRATRVAPVVATRTV